MKLLFGIVAGLLVLQANAGDCEGCGSKGCEAPALQVAPQHRVDNFDIIEPYVEVKDFEIEKPVKQIAVFDDAERRAQNEARYNANQMQYLNRINLADNERQDSINKAANIADVD